MDSSIEALGAQETFEACVKATRPGRTISNIGYHGEGDYVQMPRKEWGVGMGDKVIRTGSVPGSGADETADAALGNRARQSTASDDPSIQFQRCRKGLRPDENEGRRHVEAVDHVYVTRGFVTGTGNHQEDLSVHNPAHDAGGTVPRKQKGVVR